MPDPATTRPPGRGSDLSFAQHILVRTVYPRVYPLKPPQSFWITRGSEVPHVLPEVEGQARSLVLEEQSHSLI